MLKMHTSKKSILIIKWFKSILPPDSWHFRFNKVCTKYVLNARPYNFSSSEIYRSLNRMMLHRSKQEDNSDTQRRVCFTAALSGLQGLGLHDAVAQQLVFCPLCTRLRMIHSHAWDGHAQR